MSENGWTDDFLCKEWFKNSFIPQATARNTSRNSPLLAMAWVTDGRPNMRSLPVFMASRCRLVLRILGWFIGQLTLGDDRVVRQVYMSI